MKAAHIEISKIAGVGKDTYILYYNNDEWVLTDLHGYFHASTGALDILEDHLRREFRFWTGSKSSRAADGPVLKYLLELKELIKKTVDSEAGNPYDARLLPRDLARHFNRAIV